MICADRNYRYFKEWDDFIKTGNTHSLKILYNFYYIILIKFGKNYNAEIHLIEDAIQNVFIRLIKNHRQLWNVRNPDQYIIFSFRNELFYLLKTHRKFTSISLFHYQLINNSSEENNPDEINLELKQTLKKCIEKLTPSQQEILFMKYNIGLSYSEISETLNISLESCRTAIYRAIKSIRNEISKNYTYSV